MGKEILETGKVNVDRTYIDADELKAIRAGAWSFTQIDEYATNMDIAFNDLYNKSELQKAQNSKTSIIYLLTLSMIISGHEKVQSMS
jgi:hypothetical protein